MSSMAVATVEAGVGHNGMKKRLAQERKTFTVAILPLMRIWVLGEAGTPPVGGADDGKTGDKVVVVVEGHDRERKKREDSLQKKNWGGG